MYVYSVACLGFGSYSANHQGRTDIINRLDWRIGQKFKRGKYMYNPLRQHPFMKRQNQIFSSCRFRVVLLSFSVL